MISPTKNNLPESALELSRVLYRETRRQALRQDKNRRNGQFQNRITPAAIQNFDRNSIGIKDNVAATSIVPTYNTYAFATPQQIQVKPDIQMQESQECSTSQFSAVAQFRRENSIRTLQAAKKSGSYKGGILRPYSRSPLGIILAQV